MRNGQNIYDNMCDKLKPYIDTQATYDTASLIALLRNKPEFTLEDLVYWVTGTTDLLSVQGTKEWVDGILINCVENNLRENEYEQFPKPTLSVGQQDIGIEFYKYYILCPDSEKETIKQLLCDELIL